MEPLWGMAKMVEWLDPRSKTIEDVRYITIVKAIILARTVEREYLEEIRELEEQLAELQSKLE